MPSFTPPKGVGGKRFDQTDTPTCGQATTFNCCSDMWEATTISGGESNTSSNSGCGDGWALAKCGVDLPFKSLITSAPLSTTVNAADLTVTIDNIAVSTLADGTDGQLITWDACGAPTTVATGTAGQVLTSNGAGAAPTFQAGGGTGISTINFKACDQSISSDTTLTIDCCLQRCLTANTNYGYFFRGVFRSQTTPDFKYDFTFPTGATAKDNTAGDFFSTNTASYSEQNASVDIVVSGTNVDTTFYQAGSVKVGACAGTFGFKWAQNTSSVCCTTLKAGSYLIMWEV